MKKEHSLSTISHLLFVFIFLLAGCTAIPTEEPAGLKLPEASPTAEWTVPTAEANSCVVHGRLVSEATGGAPARAVYLAKNIAGGNKDIPAMLSFSYQTSPRALVNAEGLFYFTGVEKGEYAIALWDPAGAPYFVPDETDTDYLWVRAEPQLILDLGTINVP